MADRIIGEARALLHHTNWAVAAIGYGLGFEYATCFNSFCEQHAGTTPPAFRRA